MIDNNKKALCQLLGSTGMLIGIAWEKAFDAAIEIISKWLQKSKYIEEKVGLRSKKIFERVFPPKVSFFIVSWLMVGVGIVVNVW